MNSEQVEDALNKVNLLFDYISSKIGKDKTVEFMKKYGFDNPHILIKRDINELKQLVDKILLFREVVKDK